MPIAPPSPELRQRVLASQGRGHRQQPVVYKHTAGTVPGPAATPARLIPEAHAGEGEWLPALYVQWDEAVNEATAARDLYQFELAFPVHTVWLQWLTSSHQQAVQQTQSAREVARSHGRSAHEELAESHRSRPNSKSTRRVRFLDDGDGASADGTTAHDRAQDDGDANDDAARAEEQKTQDEDAAAAAAVTAHWRLHAPTPCVLRCELQCGVVDTSMTSISFGETLDRDYLLCLASDRYRATAARVSVLRALVAVSRVMNSSSWCQQTDLRPFMQHLATSGASPGGVEGMYVVATGWWWAHAGRPNDTAEPSAPPREAAPMNTLTAVQSVTGWGEWPDNGVSQEGVHASGVHTKAVTVDPVPRLRWTADNHVPILRKACEPVAVEPAPGRSSRFFGKAKDPYVPREEVDEDAVAYVESQRQQRYRLRDASQALLTPNLHTFVANVVSPVTTAHRPWLPPQLRQRLAVGCQPA